MSEIRELAEQKFNEFADRYDQYSDEWLDMDVQRIFAAGMREGMMRAAEIVDAEGLRPIDELILLRRIRAEADKLSK